MSLASAIKTGDVAELPGKRDEDWRWTDLRGLVRVLPDASALLDPAGLPAGPFDGLAPQTVIANGRGDARIEVRPGESAEHALRIVARGAGAHAARVSISVAAGGRLRLLESYEGEGGYLSQTSLAISLGEGAVVERIVLAQDDAEAVSVSQAEVTLSPGASFSQTVLTSGARRQRIETRVAHPGGEASLRLNGVYLLADKRHADQTTVVTHAGTDGATVQLTKGVVRDQARGVFQGRIVVSEGADRTDARMGHHALILSDRAEVDAKPELEIYADDVACAHGNTVGALDDEALFYARQRGIPEPEARSMLTAAFVGEVVDRIEHEAAREVVRAWVAERLKG
ncbi:Fe-S cluster assembly protein SufD [Phenylobacterium hankyongense]|uniref:Fe-S cluster assembly protein SufD n=1 Tax=Phenylobacterium hankyongense TaxID=1813876 RepID=A0A328B6F0_9CAUL|nr:Fe-S cluster assembly protein SufD [Phenylobacterium hankyongense]RAK61444.1 Fe-S cluster assembly protein SufD [Phenylobacterium hankyongense]